MTCSFFGPKFQPSCIFLNPLSQVQWGMLERTILQQANATTNSFYQYNQDATTNKDATTNTFSCFYYEKFDYSFHYGKTVYALHMH